MIRYVLIALVVLLALGLSSVRLLLLNVENYKTELENTVFKLTTIPVEIGTIKAKMRGFTPGIILKDIHVLAAEKDQDFPIMLDEIRLDIDLFRLLTSLQVLPSSRLTFVGGKLSVVRKKDGSLSIVGLDTAESGHPQWLLKGEQFKVLKSDITWLDEQRNTQPVHFNNVDLVINNDFGSQSHEAHLLVQLPEKYGKSLRVSLSIQGNVFQVGNVNGQIYVEGEDIHFAKFVTGDIPLGIKILAGEGSFKVWSEWHKSELASLLGSLKAQKVVLAKNQGGEQDTFNIKSLSTQFSQSKQADTWIFGVTDFALTTPANSWPLAAFNLATNDQLTHLSASISQLELQEMTELLRFFAPLDKQQNKLLFQLGLKGILKGFSIFAEMDSDQYAVNGQFENISTKGGFGFPQLENVTGSVKGTNESGLLNLNTQKARVFLPDLFKSAFSVKKLIASIKWLQMPDEWRVSSQSIVLESNDFQTESKLSLIIPRNDKPIFMDLQASFSNTSDISHIPEYYPVKIMSKDLLDWLDNAFISGKISEGKLLVYGQLDQFPFENEQGTFEAEFKAKDVELQYHPKWPHLKKLSADVFFLKNNLTVKSIKAKINGLDVNQAVVKIPSLGTSNHLWVDGQATGSILAGLSFLQETPLHDSIDSVLDAITPKGMTQITLNMKIPLVESVDASVTGIAAFKNVAVNIKAIDLNVSDVSGDLKFTEQGLFSEKIKAKALGFPINIRVDSKGFNTSIGINGKTDYVQLKKQFDFLKSEAINDNHFRGSFSYDLKLDLASVEEASTAVLNVSSDLVGLAVDLPGSLKKTFLEPKPFALNMRIDDKPLLPLTINYDDQLKAGFSIDTEKSSIDAAQLILGTGLVSMTPKKGMEIKIDKDYFDASEWLGLINTGQQENQKSTLVLKGMSLITKHMLWNGKDYGSFEMSAQHLGQHWQGNLSSAVAKGAFSIPYQPTEKDKIKLHMGFLNLSEIVNLSGPGNQLTTDDLPLINIVSEKLLWNTANLGRLDIETERLPDGVRFKRINVISKKHKIKATADWSKKNRLNSTKLKGSLLTEDMGGFLQHFGFSNDLKETEANIKFSGRWPGAPYQFSLPAMVGELNMELLDGRISSIEPGFGRVLGFLAVEQWIKRITLDFGDLYKKGLSFNSITGKYKIEKGKAVTTDLLVDAIPAQIRIVGETDLLAKTLDCRVGVIPKSSGAVPIAGTIVSSIAGTITKVFASDYEEGYFFGSKYEVTGPWDDAKVIPLPEEDGLLKKTWTGLTDFSWMKGKKK